MGLDVVLVLVRVLLEQREVARFELARLGFDAKLTAIPEPA